MGPRWPLHPQPQPDESLSSWVSRLAATYAMTQDEFFQYALDTEPLADHRLDRQPSRHLVDDLSGRTGVPPARIWAMTLVGYVPWLIDTLDTTDAACLHTYATQYQTLLRCHTPWMSKGLYHRKTGQYCLPWLGEPDPSDHALCLACLRTDRVPYLRIFWQLRLMGSGPRHGCLLTTVPWPALSTLHDTETPTEPADRDLLVVDGLSLQAVTHGIVRWTCGSHMPAAVYGRFLRSLIEELFCRRGAAGACADTIVAIWEEVGCPPYTSLTTSKPFERLTRQQQRDTLRAVGRLLSDLPASLQRRRPLTAWEYGPCQRLPYALSRLCQSSHADRGDDLPTRITPHPSQTPRCGRQGTSGSLGEAITALEQLVHSDAGAEPLIRFITAYSSQQTPEQLWQLIREIRASVPAVSPRG